MRTKVKVISEGLVQEYQGPCSTGREAFQGEAGKSIERRNLKEWAGRVGCCHGELGLSWADSRAPVEGPGGEGPADPVSLVGNSPGPREHPVLETGPGQECVEKRAQNQ